MRKIIYIFLTLFFLQSCRTQKDVLYFQNIDEIDINKANLSNINDYKFQPGDELLVNISVENEELVKPFKVNSAFGEGSNNSNLISLITYTIDKNGFIRFPQLGKIKISGLTRDEAIELLSSKISSYLKNPIINIKLNNFRVTVLGDSGGKVIDVQNENTNILEILAKSGDLKKSSDIDNLLLIRTQNNERIKYTVNLKDADIFNEPYYYVKQNDIIYIKPSKVSTFTFNNTPFAAVSTVLSLGVTIYALFIRK
ncbi:polysaccharide biosynthesis/export family protein [Weeksellaceae bacterium TAE3-ERU29]|nr:polysaccharide biosynthesis/export family protein [Weeksellaceae bacterium TAE3-ERU29]